MIASQKFGTDWPTQRHAHRHADRSGLPRWVAASTPSGTASTMASSIAVTVSCSVAGSRAAISGSDDWPCRSETPKSPWTRARQEPPVLNGQRIVEAPRGPELLDLRPPSPPAAA